MRKIIFPIVIVAVVLGFLIRSAVEESSRKVVTVKELISELDESSEVVKKRIRLGARVSPGEIKIETKDVRRVSFLVHDMQSEGSGSIKVEYDGIMPDTLREGRDVILEGDFKNGVFSATTLNTQCPSKYEPPDPSV
jgi:cytochrome c-type biogenesis protein CcmE